MSTLPEKVFGRLKRIDHEFKSRIFPLKKSASKTPQVSYALQAPRPGKLATGGRVKLIALSSAFPEKHQANLLYLVSSALPSNFRYWVERAQRENIPIVLNQNGVATPGWANSKTEEINAPLRWVLERANFVIYQSEFCKKSADQFLGPTPVPHQIVYNAVDLEQFSPSETKPEQPLTILLGGSQYQKYRVMSALEAFAKVLETIPEARLIISGKIDWQNNSVQSKKEVIEAASRLQVEKRIELTGAFLQCDAPKIYRRADLLLHTKYNDPCPTAVIEALACGLGVIHSSSGGLPELVDSNTGVGVPVPHSYEEDYAPSAEEWASAIISAANQITSLRTAARKRAVSLFGINHWLEIHQQIFKDILIRNAANSKC